MMAYRRGRGTVPLILNFGTTRSRLVSITPGHLTLDKEPQYPLNRRLGGSQTESGQFGEEK